MQNLKPKSKMKFTTQIILFLTTIFLFNCLLEKEKVLQIEGTVVDTETKSILLMKPNQDMRFDSLIEIPVENGKFYFESKLKNPEAVTLLLGEAKKNGGGRIMPLFLENDKIDLTIYSEDDFDKNKVVGGELNKQYLFYQHTADSLFKGKLFEERLKWRQEYIYENPDIVSYSLFLDHLIYYLEYIDVSIAKRNFQKLKKENPKHHYNRLGQNLLDAIENIKVGKKYIDFLAPDLNGNEIKLSDKINGKIALLDLWATWCGPCIAKSRTMVTLYNDYKDKGFTIIGIAGEFKNTDRLVKFLEKEKWAWLNLVELDRKNAIWQKYGVDGGGGGIFLIDEKGIILAKNPTAEEVRLELETRLN